MLASDERRHEIERLVRLRRERLGPPSPRQMLTARTIDPSAWSDHAEEHVAYCGRHGLLSSQTHFGAQYIVMRRLALIKAAEVLRAIDRQAAGLPDLEPLDARAVSDRLRKKAFEMHFAARPRGVHTKADGAVFFLNGCDGIPAPSETMHDDGRVTLTWSERGRTARLNVDVTGAMTMTLEPAVVGPVAMTFRSWTREDDGILSAVTDWVHHDGPVPRIAAT
jgi:hypothetical protein